MAKYAEQGAKVSIVCGTRGERGSTGHVCSIEELPEVREVELRSAMSILGVKDVTFLPYEDQKLGQAPLEGVRSQLVAIIRRTRPQVVVTFDPYGANQHTDHLAMTRFGFDSISAAADHRWYPEAGSPHVVERVLWQPPSFDLVLGRKPDMDTHPGVDFLIDIKCCLEKKEAAIRAHRTQLPGLERLFLEGRDGQHVHSFEGFRLGWGRRPTRMPGADLFE